MKSVRFWFKQSLLSAAALIGLTAIGYNFARQNLGGSDFVPRRAGACDYFLESWSPYIAETTQDITRFIRRPR